MEDIQKIRFAIFLAPPFFVEEIMNMFGNHLTDHRILSKAPLPKVVDFFQNSLVSKSSAHDELLEFDSSKLRWQ